MLTILSLLFSPLDGLADPSWQAREQASAALVSRGPLSLPTCWLGLYHPDPEVRSRSARVQRIQVCLRVESAEAGMKPEDFPFLDSLWYDTTARSYGQPWPSLEPYLCLARDFPDPAFEGIKLGLYRQASREWMRDGIAAGVPGWCYRAAFVGMRRRDAVYLGAVSR